MFKTYVNEGIQLKKEGNLDSAIEELSKALQLHPNSILVLNNLARIYESRKEFDRAITYYKRVIQLQPANGIAHAKLAKAMMGQKNIQGAIANYQKALTLQPDQPVWVYHSLGDAFKQNGQAEDAITAYQKAIEIAPDNNTIHAKLAIEMIAQKNIQGAIASYKKALTLQPGQLVWFYHSLGDAFKQNGQVKEAIAAYQKAIAIKPNVNHVIYQKLGEACQQQKRFNEAIKYFMETLKRNPSLKPVYKSLGSILSQLGENNQKNLEKLVSHCILPKSIIDEFCDIKESEAITSFNLASDLDYIEAEPTGDEVQLLQPNTLPSGLHLYCPRIAKQDKAFVIRLVNGRAWGDTINGAVITSSNQLVRNASWGNPELSFDSSNLHSPLEIDGTVAFLAHHSAAPGYYHWMTQVIPQMGLLQCCGFNLETIDKFALIKNFQSPFRKETLDILGIPQSKIIELLLNPHIKARSLLVPSSLPIIPPQKWACNFIRNTFLNHKFECSNQAKRIYITRQKTSRRRIVNDHELIAFLENFGFKTISLESLSVLEQATLFSKAEIVVAPHGAGLTNLVFCSPDTKVIEIFAQDFTPPMFQMISSYYALDYYYLISEGVENLQADNKLRDMHINVDLNLLLELMKVAQII